MVLRLGHIGRIILNFVPLPSSDSTVIFPLKFAFIVEYDMYSPRPVPFFPLVVIISLNSFSFTFLGNPDALSWTDIITLWSFRLAFNFIVWIY